MTVCWLEWTDQPVLPTLSSEYSVGGATNPTTYLPAFILNVSACNYKLSKDDTTGQRQIARAMECQVPLDSLEKVMIRIAIDSFARPASEFTNDSARTECADAISLLRDESLQSILFGKGVSNSPNSAGHALGSLAAHIDPWMFAAVYIQWGTWQPMGGSAQTAWKELLRTAIHESLHFNNIHHPTSEHSGQYTGPYYRWLNNVGGANQCVR